MQAEITEHKQKLHARIAQAFPLGAFVTRKSVSGNWVVVRHPVNIGDTTVLLAKLGGHDTSSDEVAAITRQ